MILWSNVEGHDSLFHLDVPGKGVLEGAFRIVRVRDVEIVSERTVCLPGPTKDDVTHNAGDCSGFLMPNPRTWLYPGFFEDD